MSKKDIVIDRKLRAPVEKVWKMWTTKEGLAKWWGPEGFTSEVRVLDLRVGGRFEIAMTAVLPEIVAHLTRIGVPTTSFAKGTYAEITEPKRLAYTNAVDFVPGVEPYTTTTVVELAPDGGGGTHLVVTTGAMHDENWTNMATAGWSQQIGKLEKLFA